MCGYVEAQGLPWQLSSWLPFPGFNLPFSLPPQGQKESSPKLEEAGRMKSLDPGTLKKLVNHLVPTHLHGDSSFVPAFLATYRRFATPQQVLDLLFLRLPYLQVTDPRTPQRLLGMPCTISHPEENEVLRGLPLTWCIHDQVGCSPRAPGLGLTLG